MICLTLGVCKLLQQGFEHPDVHCIDSFMYLIGVVHCAQDYFPFVSHMAEPRGNPWPSAGLFKTLITSVPRKAASLGWQHIHSGHIIERFLGQFDTPSCYNLREQRKPPWSWIPICYELLWSVCRIWLVQGRSMKNFSLKLQKSAASMGRSLSVLYLR